VATVDAGDVDRQRRMHARWLVPAIACQITN